MEAEPRFNYVLGLDLGVASVGWAVIRCGKDGEPTGLADWEGADGVKRPGLGSRIFDAGVEPATQPRAKDVKEMGLDKLPRLEQSMGAGLDQSNARTRRTARGMKRQHFRQSQRRGRQYRILAAAGLLPTPANESRKARHELLLGLDKQLKAKWCAEGNTVDQQTWTYRLRAAALAGPLEAFEVGRALYQLGHRRGFQSNRKTDPRQAEDEGDGGKKKRNKKGKGEAEQAVEAESPARSDVGAGEQDSLREHQKMKWQIDSLRKKIERSGKNTLGAFWAFVRALSDEERQREWGFGADWRIRGQFTDRQMYKQEFDEIVKAQREHHPCLRDEETVWAIRDAIFDQRPLKSSRGLIGKCPLETTQVRALKALPIAQEFRMLQKINDLEVIAPNEKEGRPLSDEERAKALEAMETHANISFNGLRTIMKLGPGHRWEKGTWDEAGHWVPDKKGKDARLVERGWTFNFEPQTEDGGKEELPGNRTLAKLRAIFSHWDELSKEVQDEVVFTLEAAERPEVIEKIARKKMEVWRLDGAGIGNLRDARLESGRAAFSRVAMEKMVEKMREKVVVGSVERYRRYQEARRAAYPKVEQAPVEDLLPPLLLSARHPTKWETKSERVADPRIAVRNPAVIRVLTETRKVVNAIIRRYGKPRLIRIESGKELAKGRKDREEEWKRNLKRRKEIDGIVRAAGGDPTNRYDREKILLADECEWTCPYSGEQITPHKLFALEQFAVEHIIPLSRSRDNTMRNKTLCRHDWNQKKNNQTPWEAFHGIAEWHDMLARVRHHFHGPWARSKAKLFEMTSAEVKAEYDDMFTERHLRDTSYAAKAARRYLSLLFEAQTRNDDGFSPQVQAVAGGMTAHLRRAWDLEKVMPTLANLPTVPPGTSDGEKFRFDHRHHALDAAVIAMTTQRQIQRLSDEIRRLEERRSFRDPVRFPKRMTPPLADCAEVFKRELEKVMVSHRQDRKVAKEFHKALAVPIRRKPLSQCTKGDIEDIVDGEVREIVQEKLRSLGISDPRRAFARAENYPFLQSKDGQRVPIYRVRLKKHKSEPIGRQIRGADERFVDLNSNYHAVIVEVPGKGSAVKWKDDVVSRYKVYQRLSENHRLEREGKARLPLVDWPVGAKPVMVLHAGDALVLDDDPRSLWTVRSISAGEVWLRPHNDARKTSDVKNKESADRIAFRFTPVDKLRQRKARKVTISPLGDFVYVND